MQLITFVGFASVDTHAISTITIMSYYYSRDPSVVGGDGRRYHRTVAEEILSSMTNSNPPSSQQQRHYLSAEPTSAATAFQHYLKGHLVTPDNNNAHPSSSPQWHVEVPALTASEKSVVLAQYSHATATTFTTNNNDWHDANELLNEYCKFMAIKIGNEQQSHHPALLCPPKTIDDMWMSHIVCTQEYWAFCNR